MGDSLFIVRQYNIAPEIYVKRENSSVNDDASAWMKSSGGAEVKTWSDGKATIAAGSGAQVETSANGDVVITLGQ